MCTLSNKVIIKINNCLYEKRLMFFFRNALNNKKKHVRRNINFEIKKGILTGLKSLYL